MKTIIEVENIKCGGCANSIKSALLKLEHVEQVEIDIENEQITIFGNFNKSLVNNKLDELGYPEKGQNTLFKKAKSYVNCAIGKTKSAIE